MNAVRIKLLKLRAKSLYLSYKNIGGQYDCGTELTEFINPEVGEIRKKFNATMKELKELDPKCPNFKLD